jgi:hypothetical protein
VLDYSEANIDVLREELNLSVPLWQIVFHAGLRRIIFDRKKDIDVLFYGFLIIEELQCLILC